MSVEQLREQLKDYAKDIRLNLGSLLGEGGAPGLTPAQVWGTALATAYATRDTRVSDAIASSANVLGDAEVNAAKAAATLMGMNNVYYRTMHMLEDSEIRKLPARLRMNILGNPGVAKVDFELYCLAVSAMAGCGACVNSHVAEVKKAGISQEGIQSAIRIASVVNATASALSIG